MKNRDRTAMIAMPINPLGDTDGARQSAVAKPAQLAIDQMIGD